MIQKLIWGVLSITLIFSCGTDGKKTTTPVEDVKQVVETPKKPKIKRAKIIINPSDIKDYPEIALKEGFPYLPETEVASVGNAVFEGSGLSMRLNTTLTVDDLVAKLDKSMIDNGWEKGKINIFKGMDAATIYFKDKLITRCFIIDNDGDQDFRKVAVTMKYDIIDDEE